MSDKAMHDKLAKFHQAHGRHWEYIYLRRRKRVLGINAGQMALTQVLSLVGSIAAGVHLEANKSLLALITGTFVILPGIFDLDGSLGAALSAKINHQLEEPKNKTLVVLINSVGFAILIAFLAGLVVAFFGGILAKIFFDADFILIFKLAIGAIMLSAVIGFPIVGVMSVFFRSIKVNPDDVVGPIESSIFDILTVVTLVLVLEWLI